MFEQSQDQILTIYRRKYKYKWVKAAVQTPLRSSYQGLSRPYPSLLLYPKLADAITFDRAKGKTLINLYPHNYKPQLLING